MTCGAFTISVPFLWHTAGKTISEAFEYKLVFEGIVLSTAVWEAGTVGEVVGHDLSLAYEMVSTFASQGRHKFVEIPGAA